MSTAQLLLKIAASTGVLVGTGYVLMRAVTPTPEQLYEKMSPDIRRKVDAARAQRLAAEQAQAIALQQQQKGAASAQANDPSTPQKPIWAEDRRY